MAATKKTGKYAEYGEKTEKFMNAVEKYLKDSFGEIKPSWSGLLGMLATNHQIFWECKDRITNEGLMIKNRFGAMDKHPLIKVMTDSQIQLVKLVTELGLSPRAAKLVVSESNDEVDFIEALTK